MQPKLPRRVADRNWFCHSGSGLSGPVGELTVPGWPAHPSWMPGAPRPCSLPSLLIWERQGHPAAVPRETEVGRISPRDAGASDGQSCFAIPGTWIPAIPAGMTR